MSETPQQREQQPRRPPRMQERFDHLLERTSGFGRLQENLEEAWSELRGIAQEPIRLAKQLRLIRRGEARSIRKTLESQRKRAAEHESEILKTLRELRRVQRRAVQEVEALHVAAREVFSGMQNEPELAQAAKETAEQQRQRVGEIRNWLEQKRHRWRPEKAPVPKDGGLARIVEVLPDLDEDDETPEEGREGGGGADDH